MSRSGKHRSTQQNHAIVAFGGAAVIIVILLFVFGLSNWFWVWTVAWSVVSFVFYGYDKMQAKRGAWRVPEVVLLTLSLIGGFAGSALGMAVFRHKIRKPLFWVAAVAGLIIFGFIFFQIR
ncbi:MAG: DUF1294 domain-containing protein [Caldilineaceae bacterium]